MKNLKAYTADFLAASLTMLMLSLIHAPFDMSFLIPAAYIPLVTRFFYTDNRRRFAALTFLASMGYWLFNIYWLTNIIAIGWIGASALMATFILLLLWGLNASLRKGWKLWIALPVIITGIECFYGIPFGGFKWHLLGHSLYRELEFIQIADITGVAGISFAIAMVNGLLCDIIIAKNVKTLRPAILITAAVIIAIWGYGKYRLTTSPANFTQGPLIAIVQSNVPSAVKEDKFEGENILNGLFELSREALDTGAGLLVWPETIVSAAINFDFLVYTHRDSSPWKYHNALQDFSAETAYLLTGATALKVGKVDGELKVTDQYNSAFLYTPDRDEPVVQYDKIHLVPFGEYIPPRNVQWLRKIFLSLSPYDYDYTLTPGTDITRFRANLEGKQWNFAAMICYEDTDAQLNRKLIYSKEKGKADWMLNISNDGWYVWYDEGEMKPSIELPQRTAISVFRAVENRITLMRSVNTGISCKIDPTGRIIQGFENGTLPAEPFDRQAVEGWFTDRPDIDPRITFFTRYGTIFSKSTAAVFILLLLPARLRRPLKSPKRKA
jgi:apolipoprotein N-acyltransferase